LLRDPCPLSVKLAIRDSIDMLFSNCSLPLQSDNTSVIPAMINCSDSCLRNLLFIQKNIHDCRDDYRFIDEIFFPVNRLKLGLVNRVCEVRRRVGSVMDCQADFNSTVSMIRNACPPNMTTCSDPCRMGLLQGLAFIDRCGSFIRDAGAAAVAAGISLDDVIVNYTRRVRQICNVTSKNVDVNVSSDYTVDVTSEDSLAPNRPRTVLRIFCNNTLEWITMRFDNFNDTMPASRYRFRVRRLHEFRPRNGSDTDMDFGMYGIDPMVDTIVQIFDVTNASDTDIDPVTDLGSIDIYSTANETASSGPGNGLGPNNGSAAPPPPPSQTPAFRYVTRASLRFGPSRLARLVLSFISTNVKNQIGDSEVTVPGGLSF